MPRSDSMPIPVSVSTDLPLQSTTSDTVFTNADLYERYVFAAALTGCASGTLPDDIHILKATRLAKRARTTFFPS